MSTRGHRGVLCPQHIIPIFSTSGNRTLYFTPTRQKVLNLRSNFMTRGIVIRPKKQGDIKWSTCQLFTNSWPKDALLSEPETGTDIRFDRPEF